MYYLFFCFKLVLYFYIIRLVKWIGENNIIITRKNGENVYINITANVSLICDLKHSCICIDNVSFCITF